MNTTLLARIYLALAALLFVGDKMFKGFHHSLPIFTPGIFLIWIKVNAVALVTKWIAVSGVGMMLELSPKTILSIGFTMGAIVTIVTLPRFKLLFLLDNMLNQLIGRKAKKPS